MSLTLLLPEPSASAQSRDTTPPAEATPPRAAPHPPREERPTLFASEQDSGRLSVSSAGTGGNDRSFGAFAAADGQTVAFSSDATNLIANDDNAARDVFVGDRTAGTTDRISIASSGAQRNGDSFVCAISDDGTVVGFMSWASNLVANDTNQTADIFVRDLTAGTTARVSVDSAGTEGDGVSNECALSADGRYVALGSHASNLVVDDANGLHDIFVHDRATGATERVSVDVGGGDATGQSYVPTIDANGQTVAFSSDADNLLPGDSAADVDIFIRDLTTGANR